MGADTTFLMLRKGDHKLKLHEVSQPARGVRSIMFSTRELILLSLELIIHDDGSLILQ